MPAYKNQHFVPRAHLKPFSLNGEGHAVSLYNSRSGRCIHGAPVKSQCARDYFYGRDRGLESKLGELEQKYATVVGEIVAAGSRRPTIATQWLRLFWCVQWGRTEAAAEAAKEVAEGMAKTLKIERHSPPNTKWVMISLAAFAKAHENAADLECVILRNRTGIPFITSDNPAAVSNKFHLVDKRVRFSTFGIGSAGALLFLPLTPEHVALFFDADVHTIAHRNGWFDIKQAADVAAINQHQVLNCQSNVYFSSERAYDWIEPSFKELASERSEPTWKQHYAVLDAEHDGVQRFKVVTGGRVRDHRQAIIITQGIPKRPNAWPSFLQWRTLGSAYDSCTAAGIVRAAHVLANPLSEFKRLRINT